MIMIDMIEIIKYLKDIEVLAQRTSFVQLPCMCWLTL